MIYPEVLARCRKPPFFATRFIAFPCTTTRPTRTISLSGPWRRATSKNWPRDWAALDVRQFVAIEDLRAALVHTIDSYLHAQPRSADRPAFEPFFFETREIAISLESHASNLTELAKGIRWLSLQSLHYHFVNSRLRLHRRTNDFSRWAETELDFPELAARIDRVDFYTNTLQGVREEILECIRPWVNR